MAKQRLKTRTLSSRDGSHRMGWFQVPPVAVGRSAMLCLALATLPCAPVYAQEDPISYVGHGALFHSEGRQVNPTPQIVERAQAHYRAQLLARLQPAQRRRFENLERTTRIDRAAADQDRLLVQNELLRWMLDNIADKSNLVHTGTKINALRLALTWKLPSAAEPQSEPKVEFQPSRGALQSLQTIADESSAKWARSVITSSGLAYTSACAAAGVPIPPPIGRMDPAGTAGWQSLGFIPTAEQFIVGTPAEVRVFRSASPEGMCIALPRYADASKSTVSLDGVLCLGRATSKMCMWDNQMSGATFTFPSGTVVPIGAPDLAINPAGKYQAGGAELEFGAGGVCTNCHAGQNPYIIHPQSNLGSVLFGSLGAPPLSLPTFAAARYDPLAPASWPQNNLSMSPALVPPVCAGCHFAGGPGGAFPHLSAELSSGYCTAVLTNAINRTMPPGAGGSQASNPAVIALKNWCGVPASAGPSNRGDPHLTTGGGIHYDFHAAGEFTALSNSASGFELQTRQTPVLTATIPVADAYTGLASCVSLNTAVALRLGKHRVTIQPPASGGHDAAQPPELRVDGGVVKVPKSGLNFTDGSRITLADSAGALDVKAADGTHVIVASNFWTAQGYWYLNVDVLNSPAREGLMATLLPANWLPLAPDGSSFGPAPSTATARHALLNQKFANAWRVAASTSLFDYVAGTSTKNFTDVNWPPAPGKACTGSPLALNTPVRPMNAERARSLCVVVKDASARESCVFDAIAMADTNVPQAYLRSLKLRAAAIVP